MDGWIKYFIYFLLSFISQTGLLKYYIFFMLYPSMVIINNHTNNITLIHF
uniref:Uncharacterized protein n=1 Tax=Physcomitrium patens TaxID=3218 RepID=A0A2K1IJY8_PHYPA|nr:hypothetical protein PHYPA_028289 [Physcomitrium patens]